MRLLVMVVQIQSGSNRPKSVGNGFSVLWPPQVGTACESRGTICNRQVGFKNLEESELVWIQTIFAAVAVLHIYAVILDFWRCASLATLTITGFQDGTLGVCGCSDVTKERDFDSGLTRLDGETVLCASAIDQSPPESLGGASVFAVQVRLTASVALDFVQAA